MSRFWVALQFLVIVLCVAGCSNFSDRAANQPGTGAPREKEFVWLTRYDVKTLDPAAVQEWTSATVLSYVYPSIGELCDVTTSNSKDFVIKLHPSTFSNGDPVTAEDIKFTIERCLLPEIQSSVGNQYASQIKGDHVSDNATMKAPLIKTSEDGTVTFSLVSPDQAFAAKLKHRSFGVLNRKVVDLHKPIVDGKVGAGAGNWTFESVAPGREWKLRNSKTKELLRFRYSGDSANRRNLFDTNQADYAMFAAHEIGVVKGHSHFSKGGPTTLVYLQLNPKTQPVLATAGYGFGQTVAEEADFARVLSGAVEPAHDFLALSGIPYKRDWEYMGNPTPPTGHFEITYAEIGMQNPSVEEIVSRLKAWGMDIQGRAMVSGAMLEKNSRGEIPMLFTGWQPDFDGPLNTIPMLFHSKSSENRSGYHNAKVDALIEAAQRGENPEKNIVEAWKLIEMDMPCVPLYIQRDLVLKRNEPPKP